MIYDLSPVIDERLGVWPGDTAPTREVLLDTARGDNITLSTLRTTVHLGTHADAPSHYGRGAPSMETADLGRYIGACDVVSVDARRGERFGVDAIRGEVGASRVLLRTGTFPDAHRWNDDFAAPAPEVIGFLAERGVRLVGVDTPSVDLIGSKDLPTHLACLKRDVWILEGLRLEGVPDGRYELIALPLKLRGFDGSPVRAVLRTVDDGAAQGVD